MPKKMLLILLALNACSLGSNLIVDNDTNSNPHPQPPITEPETPGDPQETSFLSKVSGKFVHSYLTIPKGLVYTINDQGTLYYVKDKVRRYYHSEVSPTRAIYREGNTWFFGVEIVYGAGRTNFNTYYDLSELRGWFNPAHVSWDDYNSWRFELELRDTK